MRWISNRWIWLTGALALAAVAALAGSALGASAQPASARATGLSAIKHVWIIELENESYAFTFGKPGAAPYLARTLTAKGAFLTRYYGIAHDSLPNYIAEVSGQAPNYQTGQDCEKFTPFVQFGGENYDEWTRYGQLSGDGCFYPAAIKTVGDQLTAKGLSWKAYEEDMGNNAHRDRTTATPDGPVCGHPAPNAVDLTDTTGPKNDSYATRHDPFMYFESIIGNQQACDAHIVSLRPLAKDLASASTTPSYSFITPNTCHDAHDTPKCQDGSKGGLGQADAFLERWVPTIMRSPAYHDGGLIAIVFDESGDDDLAGACCGEVDGLGYDDPSHPNTNEPGLYGPGGGRVGAVLLSPFIKPGTRSAVPYNHYSLLRSVEDAFGLAHLGDAREHGVRSFGADVFTR